MVCLSRNYHGWAAGLVLAAVSCFWAGNLHSATPQAKEAGKGNHWAEFRGDTGQGISFATNVPVHWNAQSNVSWKVALPGKGWSSPVLVDGRIYLTTAVGTSGDTSLRALCLDASTGSMIWNVEVFRPEAAATKKIHTKNSLASPTALFAGDKVFVHFGHMGTASLDLNGRILWKQTALQYEPFHGNGGSPILVGDLLVFGCDGIKDPELVALNAASGEIKWRTPRNTPARNKFSFGTPLLITVEGKPQVIAPCSGMIAGYAPADGREIWRVRYGEGYSVITKPVYSQGLLYVSSSYDSPVVYAVNPAGAQGDVTTSHVAWKTSKGAPNTPSCLAVGEELYYVSDNGVASCVDAKKGTLHWSERLGGGFSASPFLAEGRIYFQNEEGVGTVVRAGKTFERISRNELGERTLATPTPADNCLYIRTAENLYKIKAQ